MTKQESKIGKSPFGRHIGLKPGTAKYRKAHNAYVLKWRRAGHDKYAGPGRRVEDLPEHYRPLSYKPKKPKKAPKK